MLGLYISLAFLGLVSIDPIGISIVLILLAQKHPCRRALLFLAGNFVALMVMGVLFAKGLGQIVLYFEHHNQWLIPIAEIVVGTGLLIVAGIVFMQARRGKFSVEPSKRMRRWLRLNDWQLFIFGVVLIIGLSLVDLVFIIAMVRLGQAHSSNFVITIATAIYSVAALFLQALVIMAFYLAPTGHKTKTIQSIHGLLTRYSSHAIIVVGITIGCALLFLAA